MQNHLKYELHNVLSGKSKIRFGTIIQSIASYLIDGAQTSKVIEDEKHFKHQETKKLEEYITKENLWIKDIDLSQYVSITKILREKRIQLKRNPFELSNGFFLVKSYMK